METTITPEQALELILGYQKHPLDYIRDVYGVKPWKLQCDIVESVFKYRETAVKTCNSVGKSYIAAAVAHAYLDLYPGSIVVTTAPTWSQVKDVLWRYIGTIHAKAIYPLGGRLTQTGLEYDADWFAIGRSTNRPENLFGYHADHILVIVDEAGGVDEPIFKGVKAITPNVNARTLYIGNPTSPDGTFANAFKNPRIKQFSISAFDSPNLQFAGIDNLEKLIEVMTPPPGVEAIDHDPFEGVEWPIPELISPAVVYDRFIEWGVDSPAWQSLVMGEFPSQSEQALIPVDLVTQAMQMQGIDEASGKTYAELSGWEIPDGPPEYGLDVARFGGDLNVLTTRRGGFVEQLQVWNKKGDEKLDLVETADRALESIDVLNHNARINIDDTGVGGGVSDYLRRRSNEEMASGRPAYQYQLAKYNFASKEFMQRPDKFHDITSELYWALRGWFYKKQISLPYDERLFRELVGRRWQITPAGKIKVESKEDYKKRTGGRSPDRSDSLALAFAGGERIASAWVDSQQRKTATRKPFTSGLKRGERIW